MHSDPFHCITKLDASRTTVDRQRHVHAPNVSFKAKKIQSDVCMKENNFTGFRNRAMLLAKTFSVSRQVEVANWDIADLYPITYEADLPSTGSMDMKIVQVVQDKYKTKHRQKVKTYCLCTCRSASHRGTAPVPAS